MYRCEEHGKLDTHWCDDCKKIIQCDCSNITSSRVKDLVYDCEDGEKTVTVHIEHCETCGEVMGVSN